ncbi:uncharacterized protein LOC109837719 [Asparagus officinalis]|uniref:uncharacterized protein LOC109837719 n=1 Tax=Asparagus officinalis TaxID=4686 RepID=UPI00098E4508|nr:uncharacterized protein LOC109837719 [Asparagus officinalis]
MNLTFWNIRGLNKSSKQLLVNKFLLQYHISFIALLETKIKESKLPNSVKRITNDWKWLSNVRNSSKARILILWDPRILDTQIVNISDQQITCAVKSFDGRLDCVISSVYGFNQMEGRKELWADLIHIQKSIGNVPWLICGDFNAMADKDDKLGGVVLSDSDTRDFSNCIADCHLNHMKTLGCFYTWNNKQEAETRVWSRLDRALINDQWISAYNSSYAEYLLPQFSDHSPGLISIYEDCLQGKKPFKFFKMWTKHADYLPTVSDIWKTDIQGCAMYSVYTKLKKLKEALKILNKRHFHNISEQVQRAKIVLEDTQSKLQNNPLDTILISREKENLSSYNKLLDCEESFYQQKARIAWSVHGDRSTRYFHSTVKRNRHNNNVGVLYNSRGDRITDGGEIVTELISFFTNLLGTSVATSPPDKNIIKSGPCLSEAQIKDLSKPVSIEEIKEAIFSMSDNKAPGPDGYSASFFKTAWPVIGEDILKSVRDFFRNGKLLGSINSTAITLVPKVQCPKTPADFRPIACCNCLYKFISKVLANRIKSVIGYLVDEAQSAFIKGRQIFRNISLAHELVKNYKRKHISPRVMLNIDIKKAFDTISWSFLTDMLKGPNFPELQQCVKEFSAISGLVANPEKSSVFYGGLEVSVKSSIANHLGFTEGILPIKYLGVPLISRRLSFLDCEPLFSKITNQLQSWMKYRNLSYAGRLQIIKSVILGIQIYWTSAYILPISVLHKIDEMCRNFLWGKTNQAHKKPPLVLWEKVCQGKSRGGLGIFSAVHWNFASAVRTIWYIHENKESLWIKWVHESYLKQGNIWQICAKRSDSWLWRQLLKMRDKAIVFCGGVGKLKELIISCCQGSKIKLSALYEALAPAASKVQWYKTIWDDLSIPKHSFIHWLAVQNKLLTQDRLMKRGIISINSCSLCTGSCLETRDHLFFECTFSCNVWNHIMEWLKFDWRSTNWQLLQVWYNARLRGKGAKQRIKRLALNATIYSIWRERNLRLFQQQNRNEDQLVRVIKIDIATIILNSTILKYRDEYPLIL